MVEQWNHNSHVVGSSPTFAKSGSFWWFNNCVFIKSSFMEQKVRPLSPHLTVYKPQLTSVLSIFHRITGGFLGLFIVFNSILVHSSLFFVGSSHQYCFSFDFSCLFSTVILAVGYFVVFIASFHFTNGVRHLSWDFALGLEIKNLYTTGMMVLVSVSLVVVVTILL